ncbi:mitochondrial inner-membrane-bound regulator-domain-containing protein [Jackrogersella minutella]|nr:mitochondrial inner-membrane-bound regulator-domain-containing protein [Jackrogersella minutella]
MIATRVSGGAVCFRCRLRLLRQATQQFHPSSRIVRNQHLSLRRYATESPIRASGTDLFAELDTKKARPEEQVHREEAEGQGQDGSPPAGEKLEGNEAPEVKRSFEIKRVPVIGRGVPVPEVMRPIQIRKVSERKRRLSRNRILTEDAASLGSDMLGKPASVIVMRDGGVLKKKKRQPDPDLPDDESISQSADIEALLVNQRVPPLADEVYDNISELKPETETVLSGKEFYKLQDSLMDGFLVVQLIGYLEHHKETTPPPNSDETVDPLGDEGIKAHEYGWIRSISPWIPLGNPASVRKDIDPILRGYVNDQTTAKERLAVRIMRECWGLSISALNAGIGETTVKLGKGEFMLLMRGTQRWMTVMSKIFLEPGEKIEAFRNSAELRFVTTRTKAATLIKELDDTLKKITVKTFPVNLVTRDSAIDEAALEELGRITNSHIRVASSSGRIHVTWIEFTSRADRGIVGLEDLREVIFRLLLTTLNPPPVTTFTLHVAGLDHIEAGSEGVNGRYIPDVVSKEKLSWKDKLSQWARYTLPLEPTMGSSPWKAPLAKLPLSVEPQPAPTNCNENGEFLPETPFPAHPVKWAQEYTTSTKATFGFVLHANNPSAPPPALPDLVNNNSTHPRVFAPATPHPQCLAKLEVDAQALVTTKTTVVVHLWPSPSILPQPVRKRKTTTTTAKPKPERTYTPPAPLLELRLAVQDDEIIGVEGLRAVRQTRIADVLLPAQRVDVRLSQSQFCELSGRPEDLTTWQPLVDFLAPARLDLADGKLEMPPHQRFPVPRRLFGPDALAPKAKRGADAADPDELISTSYNFAGLEVRRQAAMPYRHGGPTLLTYTSVDAVRGAGPRAEVSLEPAFEQETARPADGDKANFHDNFLAACQDFARSEALWSGFEIKKRSY